MNGLSMLTSTFTSWFQPSIKPKNKTTKFPLQKLPHLARKEVFSIMESMELIKLSTLSKNMSNCVGICQYKPLSYQLEIMKNSPDTFTFFDPSWVSNVGMESRQVKSFDLTYVIRRIQNAFPKSTFRMIIEIYNSSLERIQEVLFLPELMLQCTTISVNGGNVQIEIIDYFMNLIEEGFKPHLHFGSINLPWDYSHPNAFDGAKITYESATWVELEDLYNLKSTTQNLTLVWNSFHADCLNLFFKRWIHHKCDIYMKIHINIPMYQYSYEKLFDRIVTLGIEKNDKIVYTMILSKNTTTRKRPVMGVGFKNGQICIQTYSIRSEGNKMQSKGYSILKKVNKKSDLEGERKRISIQQREEGPLSNFTYTIIRINGELKKIVAELAADDVYFVGGCATIHIDRLLQGQEEII